jgi:hypothetical protein
MDCLGGTARTRDEYERWVDACVKTEDMQVKAAVSLGAMAGKMGLKAADNPFPGYSELYRAWRRGRSTSQQAPKF